MMEWDKVWLTVDSKVNHRKLSKNAIRLAWFLNQKKAYKDLEVKI